MLEPIEYKKFNSIEHIQELDISCQKSFGLIALIAADHKVLTRKDHIDRTDFYRTSLIYQRLAGDYTPQGLIADTVGPTSGINRVIFKEQIDVSSVTIKKPEFFRVTSKNFLFLPIQLTLVEPSDSVSKPNEKWCWETLERIDQRIDKLTSALENNRSLADTLFPLTCIRNSILKSI